MNLKDITALPCACGECIQAGVTSEKRRRDPRSGVLLHGYALRRWLDARADFMKRAREAVGPPGRRGAGFEKLAADSRTRIGDVDSPLTLDHKMKRAGVA